MKIVRNRGGCLLAVAPNGARKTKADHPQIPLSIKEIGETAKNCLAAGASMIHLHVRNSDGSHSLSVEHYTQAINEIREQTNDGIFIQVTSEAVGIYSAAQQFEMIHKLQPSAVSIALREIQLLDEALIHQHFVEMRESKTFPQLILYNQSDLSLYIDWLERSVIPGDAYPILLVIGKETPEGSFDNYILTTEFTQQLGASSWMICAFGENEFEAGQLASNIGGNIRIGFENNNVLKDGRTAYNNAELIFQIAQTLKETDIPLANIAQTIEIMKPDW